MLGKLIGTIIKLVFFCYCFYQMAEAEKELTAIKYAAVALMLAISFAEDNIVDAIHKND